MFGRVIPEQRGDVRGIIGKFYSQLMWHDVMWHGVLKFLVKASRNSWWKDTGCNLQHTFSDKSSGGPGDLRVATSGRPRVRASGLVGPDVEPRVGRASQRSDLARCSGKSKYMHVRRRGDHAEIPQNHGRFVFAVHLFFAMVGVMLYITACSIPASLSIPLLMSSGRGSSETRASCHQKTGFNGFMSGNR